jgi:hypothetical protein
MTPQYELYLEGDEDGDSKDGGNNGKKQQQLQGGD